MRSAYSSHLGNKPPSTRKKKKSDKQRLLPSVLVKPSIIRSDSQNTILQAFVKTQNASAKTSLDRLLSMNSPINLQLDPADENRTFDCMP